MQEENLFGTKQAAPVVAGHYFQASSALLEELITKTKDMSIISTTQQAPEEYVNNEDQLPSETEIAPVNNIHFCETLERATLFVRAKAAEAKDTEEVERLQNVEAFLNCIVSSLSSLLNIFLAIGVMRDAELEISFAHMTRVLTLILGEREREEFEEFTTKDAVFASSLAQIARDNPEWSRHQFLNNIMPTSCLVFRWATLLATHLMDREVQEEAAATAAAKESLTEEAEAEKATTTKKPDVKLYPTLPKTLAYWLVMLELQHKTDDAQIALAKGCWQCRQSFRSERVVGSRLCKSCRIKEIEIIDEIKNRAAPYMAKFHSVDTRQNALMEEVLTQDPETSRRSMQRAKQRANNAERSDE